MKRVLVLMCALLVSAASVAGAQIASGNIYGTVVDEQGGVLPGADVTLLSTSIGGAPRTTVTDSRAAPALPEKYPTPSVYPLCCWR